MTGRYEHVLAFAYEHPWALTDHMRAEVGRILAGRIMGEATDPATLAALVNRSNLPQPKRGGVAIIPIYGVIAPRMNMLSEFSGGTTFEQLTAQLHDAMANAEVKTIVFDVDSPGGNVAGASEFAAEVLKARATKPIIAQAQYLMASAAYWPMSCATQIIAAPSAMVGSIGVYAIHTDVTEAMEKLGVKKEVIAAGKYKAEGAGIGPLTDEARAHIKSLIEGGMSRFVNDIAKGRGVSAREVRAGYGEGRVIAADEALSLGMIDRIGTLADTLSRVMADAPALSTSPRAVTDQERPLAATSQERHDATWQNTIEADLLALEL